MPYTERQRKFAFAEIQRRKKGKKSRGFKGMSTGELETYAHSPLEKKKKGYGKGLH